MKGDRTFLVLAGMTVAIVGYAFVYSGLSHLNPRITPSGREVGTLDSMIPGKAPAKAAA